MLRMRQAQEITLAEAAAHIGNTSKRHTRPFFFMVGAGVSYPPIPLASHIVEACKKDCGACEAPEGLHPMGVYSWWFQRAFHSPADRQWYLRSLIENRFVSQANLRLAHLLLSKKLSNLVITTNFDDFVSKSLTIFGEPHIVCDLPETIQRIDPESDDLQIVHVHGTYWFYDCCNLEGEVEARSRRSRQTASSMADFLDRVLNNRSPLVLGYSGWEGDVFMSALKRRLKRGLPYNLYWFCYQRGDIQNLPSDLTDHPNVYFVVPELTKSGSDSRRSSGRRGSPSLKPAADEKTSESHLAASEVLDAIVSRLALDAPPLTRDPLGFFAEHLRRSLPPDEAVSVRPDPYLIGKVIRRIERARQNLTATEQKLESVRDAVRRSQYREAIGNASAIMDADIDKDEIGELTEMLFLAGSKLSDNSPDELAAYERVIRSGDALLQQLSEDSGIKHCVAKALVNKANVLGSIGRTPDAVLAYDEVVARFETSAESALRYQVARAIYNKAVTCEEAKDSASSLKAYMALVERFADSREGNIRALIAWALYNQAVTHGKLDHSDEEEKLYMEIVNRFDEDTIEDCREAVVLAFNGISDNIISAAKKIWLAGDEDGGKARLREAQSHLAKASERNQNHPYVLGSQAYLDFLLGDKVRARELLARAVALGGEELRSDELDAAKDSQLLVDDEFIQILQALPAPRTSVGET
jgi:hypothetical protein